PGPGGAASRTLVRYLFFATTALAVLFMSGCGSNSQGDLDEWIASTKDVYEQIRLVAEDEQQQYTLQLPVLGQGMPHVIATALSALGAEECRNRGPALRQRVVNTLRDGVSEERIGESPAGPF